LELVRPQMLRRRQTAIKLRSTIVSAMECILGDSQPLAAASKTSGGGQKRCYICPRSKDRKSRKSCIVCKKPVCSEHSKKTLACINCDK
jgi:hypothetical protein